MFSSYIPTLYYKPACYGVCIYIYIYIFIYLFILIVAKYKIILCKIKYSVRSIIFQRFQIRSRSNLRRAIMSTSKKKERNLQSCIVPSSYLTFFQLLGWVSVYNLYFQKHLHRIIRTKKSNTKTAWDKISQHRIIKMKVHR